MTVELLPPLRAIRFHCVQCCAEYKRWPNGPRGCNTPQCGVYAYRNGGRKPDAPHTPLRSIRRRCLQCAYTRREARNCSDQENCHLFPYRLGRNPNRSGVGRERNLKGSNPPLNCGLGAPDRVAADGRGERP